MCTVFWQATSAARPARLQRPRLLANTARDAAVGGLTCCPLTISMFLPPRSMAVRISGPLVSSMVAMVLPLAAATLRTRSSTSLCPAWSPWLKLKRATFMPASISAARPSSDQQDGPSVQRILVLRALGMSIGVDTRSRLTCGSESADGAWAVSRVSGGQPPVAGRGSELRRWRRMHHVDACGSATASNCIGMHGERRQPCTAGTHGSMPPPPPAPPSAPWWSASRS